MKEILLLTLLASKFFALGANQKERINEEN